MAILRPSGPEYDTEMSWWPARLDQLGHEDFAEADRLVRELVARCEAEKADAASGWFGPFPIRVTVRRRV